MGAEILWFQDFELDRGAYQLRHAGQVVHLQRIPLDLLFLMVEQRGQMVTRQEIVERIWGKGVFLDSDNSINAAVRKLRRALNDNPASPASSGSTGKGYRFVAQVREANAGFAQIRPDAEFTGGTRARDGRVARRIGRGGWRAWRLVHDFRRTRHRQDAAGGGAVGPGPSAVR